MYFILLTNFIDENNNFFIIFCKLFIKYGCHHMLIFLIINVMYFILNLLTGWGMKKKIYREREGLSFMLNIACKTEHEECCGE
jgi:hypothetical protein